MWNAMKTRSLVGALLITATIQGALLRGMNEMAVAGVSSGTPVTAGSRVTTTPEPAVPEAGYVTLEPVLVVGRRQTFATEQASASEMPGACSPKAATATVMNNQKNGAASYC